MEDLKSQDTNLAMEMSKIKAMQGKLAKKHRGQEKDKTTGPKQETKFKNFLNVVMFLVFFGLLLIVNNRGYERKLQKSADIIANQTRQIEALIMEKTKMDLLNETTVEESPDNSSYIEKSLSFGMNFCKGLFGALGLTVLIWGLIGSMFMILTKLFDWCFGKSNDNDQLYLQIQNLVKELETSDEILSMTNQRLKPFLKNSINAKNESGSTYLHTASRYGRTDQVRILLELGADVHIKNADDHTPLILAVRDGHVDVAKLLLQNGDFVNSKDKHGATPLHYNSEADIVQLLLKNGADLETIDSFKNTPLTWGCL